MLWVAPRVHFGETRSSFNSTHILEDKLGRRVVQIKSSLGLYCIRVGLSISEFEDMLLLVNFKCGSAFASCLCMFGLDWFVFRSKLCCLVLGVNSGLSHVVCVVSFRFCFSFAKSIYNTIYNCFMKCLLFGDVQTLKRQANMNLFYSTLSFFSWTSQLWRLFDIQSPLAT